MAPHPYRLAAVASHPVQYQAPLFRQIAAHDGVDLTVFYGHDGSVAGDLDREFGQRIRWDRPLLDSYRSVFLQRRSDRMNGLRRLAADAQIVAHLWRQRFDAVFVHSYATRLSLFAYIGALVSRTARSASDRVRAVAPQATLGCRTETADLEAPLRLDGWFSDDW